MKLVECVPNFSEGRDKKIIDQIASVIEETEEVKLLDVDMGADTNRTVVTFVGSPEGVAEAAFKAIKKASELIDMAKHKGAHARMGATDVCPFVPVANVTMEECVEIAKKVGKRVGDELGIPVYLYEYAATKPERKNLAVIREGEYEGLPEKLKKTEWKPDFGPAQFNAKSGATVIGAREFLIAYNINLATKDKKLANKIAFEIREKGKVKRDENGKIVRDENGNKVYIPGKFKEVKAVGWYMEEFGCAQVSINFTNYKISPVHIVFDEVCRLADQLGVRVTGSELVGLIPKDAIIQAGMHYLKKQGSSTAVPENVVVDIAVRSLGLNDLYPFEPDKKIIEYIINKDRKLLVDMSVSDFVDELSSDSPAPGGGSVSALAGSLAAGLGAMVTNLTFGKKAYKDVFELMSELGTKLQSYKQSFIDYIDKDTDSFNKIMDAFKLPKKTEEQIAIRNQAIQEATKDATMIPFEVMTKITEIVDMLYEISQKGNQNSLSDAGVSLLMARSGLEGAYMNVLINLQGIEDQKFKNDIKSKADELKETYTKKIDEYLREIYNKLV